MTDRTSRNRKAGAAFTLVEMLAVMAIIALLAGIIVAGSSYAARQADQKRARARLERIQHALTAYRTENGRYPPVTFNGAMTNAAWSVLTTADRALRFPDDLIDPWGRAYIYTHRSRFAYQILSRGPDASAAAVHDDISNEQISE